MTNLNHLIAEATALAGEDLCAAGHNWITLGGRECPHGSSNGLSGCSQPVFECARCGAGDYGDKGGPAYQDCATNCTHGHRDKFA